MKFAQGENPLYTVADYKSSTVRLQLKTLLPCTYTSDLGGHYSARSA